MFSIAQVKEGVMPKRPYLFLLLVLLMAACQTNPVTPPTFTPVSVAATDAPEPTVTPSPTPAASSADGWRELLSYLSPEWLNTHSTESPLGSVLYLADIAQLRADLKLPPFTGEDDRKAKLPLIAKLPTMMPDVASSGYFKQWGWDIADVQQTAYIWDDFTRLFRGDFARPEIKQRLLDQGYTESQLGEFTIFTKAGPRVDQYAWKPDTIIISDQESKLKSLIQRKLDGRAGLDQHPVVAQILQHSGGSWGGVMATAGDAQAMQHTIDFGIDFPSDFEPALKDKRPELLNGNFEFGWDVMAANWRGAKPDVAFTIIYHYPSSADAVEDIPLFKKTLIDTPSIGHQGRLTWWSDMLKLHTVETDGALLIGQATAGSEEVFVSAITNLDFTFLPVRTAPRAVSPTPSVVSAAKMITSPYGSGWTLYTNEREGFAVALPPHWAQIDLDPDFLEAGLKLWQDQNPDLPKGIGDQARRAAASGIKFIGFDVSSAGRKASFQVNVNVMRADLPRGTSLDSVVSQLMQQLDRMTTIVKPVQHQRVQLKAGEAEKLQETQKVTLSSGKEPSLDGIHYYLVQGNSLYVLSLLAPSEYSKNYAKAFEQIADSFQFVR
jgi:hypothetical protein